MRSSISLVAALKRQCLYRSTVYSQRFIPRLVIPRTHFARTFASKSTLGFDAVDDTKIINEFRSEDGEILKLKVTQRAAQVSSAVSFAIANEYIETKCNQNPRQKPFSDTKDCSRKWWLPWVSIYPWTEG